MDVTVRLQEDQHIQKVGMHNCTKKKCIYSQILQIRPAAGENIRWQHSNCISIEEPNRGNTMSEQG